MWTTSVACLCVCAFSSNMSSVPSSTWTPHIRSWHRGQCAMLSPLQRARRPVSLAGGRRIRVASRACVAGGCTYVFEAARHGNTAVTAKLATQSAKRHVVVAVMDWSRSMVLHQTDYRTRASSTFQTRQSRHLPFVRRCARAPRVQLLNLNSGGGRSLRVGSMSFSVAVWCSCPQP